MNTFTSFFNKNLKMIFWGVMALQLVIMLVMSQQAGISADEYRHIKQAVKVYNYYESDGEDLSALENTGIDPMQFNGQSFDNLMYFFTKKFEVENYMEMRHFFNALLGWLIILLTGFIAKEFWGWKGALLAVFILFVSPRFLGHSMNNNKDIPFAFGFIMSFYGTLLFLKDLPKLRWQSISILVVGTAAAISIRMAGLLSIGFLGLFSAFHFLSREPINKLFTKEKSKLFKQLLWSVPLIAVVAYFLGIAFWPFMMVEPIENLKKVLDATAAHPISLNQLFEGNLVMSNTLPSYYSLKWALITYPIVVMVGAACMIIFAKNIKKEQMMTYFYLVFALIFVLAWMSLRQSNFYGAIRHLLFIYPIAVLVSVAGFKLLSEFLSAKKAAWMPHITVTLVLLLSIQPISHIIRNYPYSYVYFNEISGGMDNVFDKYETDYFQHSIRHATEWLMENEFPKAAKEKSPVIIASNDDKNCRYWTREHKDEVKIIYTRYYEKYAKDWDYAVYYCGYITPEQLSNKQWPPAGTIHTEMVDGFPVAAVVKRTSKEDLEGYKVLDKNPGLALLHFNNFLKKNAPNEQLMESMARACLYTGQTKEAIQYADKAIELNPRSINAMWLQVSALMSAGDFKSVPALCDKITNQRARFYQAYYQKGMALRYSGEPNAALKEFAKALKYNPRYYEAYMQMGDIYINYKQYQQALSSIYATVNKVKPNDFRAAMMTAKCYHFLNQDAQAEKILGSVPANLKNNPDYIIVKARILIGKGQLAEANALLQASQQLGNNAELFLVKGLLSQAQGQADVAKANYKRALQLDPTLNEAKERLK